MQITYQTPSILETEPFWQLMNQLDDETPYMLYEPGERKKNLTEVTAMIKEAVAGEDFLLVAKNGPQLVGYISAQKGKMHRIAHSAHIVVGILKDYRGQGIGTTFFKQLDAWATEKHISRLELTVICENEAAKHLYLKSGFEIEGTKRQSICLDGRYLDEYYMAKLL